MDFVGQTTNLVFERKFLPSHSILRGISLCLGIEEDEEGFNNRKEIIVSKVAGKSFPLVISFISLEDMSFSSYANILSLDTFV